MYHNFMNIFKDLENKIILITGSSRGIGYATAEVLSGLGAKVILNSSSSKQVLKKAAEEINAAGYYLCDITDEKQVEVMIDYIIKDFGHIDGLVNNAGGGGWASLANDDTEWQKSWDLDVMGAVHVCRYAIPYMQKQEKGSIVNVTSMWGIEDTSKPVIASYCAAKAALEKLTKVWAREFAPDIRVNAVAPGWTRTKMLEDKLDDESVALMSRNVLLGRIAEAVEIAYPIVFMLSDAASYITGTSLSVDGGYLLAREHPEE